MSNDCLGTMRVVSKDKEAIRRFENIMRYKDDEFFCYKVKEFDCALITVEDEYWQAIYHFDVGWSMHRWFEDNDDPSDIIVKGYTKDCEPIYGTAHYTSVTHLCKVLGIGVEAFSTEPGMGLAEHAACGFNGNYDYRSEDYEEDGDGNETINGFGDSFEVYGNKEEIYNGRKVN